jgi:hypothetical protein
VGCSPASHGRGEDGRDADGETQRETQDATKGVAVGRLIAPDASTRGHSVAYLSILSLEPPH